MEHSSGIQASLAGRYASALFGLAREQTLIESVEKDLSALEELSTADSANYSEDFSNLLLAQTVSAKAAQAVMSSIATSMKLQPVTANFLGVLAENGRLAKLPAVITAFKQLAADSRGEIHADVTSAFALNSDQRKAIASQLKSHSGRKVIISEHVDPDILGGLVVKIGSQMIDSSIKTRLNTLSQAMKG
ncbi:F0F1 ATP synthase subunit delta [Parasphingorhabdus sp. DH2-15]|uniref:F0F1 ATP synthase subunit delta n=1 Tax=Parasphingorhabdus sp. DH2-15 TaxID=3444112 RepID=UPI003F684794